MVGTMASVVYGDKGIQIRGRWFKEIVLYTVGVLGAAITLVRVRKPVGREHASSLT
jgi:hypothetical protein